LKFLLLNQTFHPDVMATGQYLGELAMALVERGHQVTVVTSQRAYDAPDTRFAKFEVWRGITIHRVGSTRFGKGAKWKRAADFASFILACCFRLLTLPRPDVVLALTSPPLISFIGAWLAKLSGSRFVYWVMDFNPDEAIAAGWLRADSLAGRLLDRMSRFSLHQASRIIALDRFMRDRIVAKGISAEKIAVLPPWSHDDQIRFDPGGRDEFRRRHGLADKFVVMYSGNHSPVHSLDTLLAAARRLAGHRDIVFAFIGGGSEFKRIQAEQQKAETLKAAAPKTEINPPPSDNISASQPAGFLESSSALCPPPSAQPSTRNPQPPNLFCLPYQPLSELAASLSAADLHVVVMGNAFVGLVHPCKIYNILAVGAPVLYIGPAAGHVPEILASVAPYPHLSVRHGEGESLAPQILTLRHQPSALRRPPSAVSRQSSAVSPSPSALCPPPSVFSPPPSALRQFSKPALLPKFIELLESR